VVDIYTFISLLTFILNLSIFSYVLGQRRKSRLNTSFLLYTFFMSIVPLIDYLSYLPFSPGVSLFFNRLLLTPMLSLGFLFLNFVYELLGRKQDTAYRLSFLVFILSLCIVVIFPPVRGVKMEGSKVLLYMPTIWLIISFNLSLTLVPLHPFWLCFERLRNKASDPQLVKQLRLVLAGSVLSSIVSVCTVCGAFVLGIPILLRFACLGILTNTLFLYLAIQRHYFLCVNNEQIEQSFRHIFENVHDAVILFDQSGFAAQINRSAHSLLGNEANGLTGLSLQKLVEGYEFSQDYTGNPASITDASGRKDLILSQSPIKSNGKLLGKLLIIHDITVQKKTEQQLARAKNIESIGQLAAGVAHDFNNYLCGIISCFTLGKMELGPESKVAEILSEGEKVALAARELTNQILSFAKGGPHIETVFDINELIKEAGEFSVRGSGVSLKISLDEQGANVKGDKSQIRQVFQNVILNAVQSMPGGGEVKITGGVVTLEEDELPPLGKGCYFKAMVADTGCGMSPDIQTRIFDPYFTTKSRGSGLGLAVVYSVLTKHKGYVTVESQENKGTVFTILLPVAHEPVTILPAPSSPLRFVPGRILIMDDYAPVRMSLSLILKRLGFDSDHAASGKEALEKYDKTSGNGKKYSAVITDLTVPGGMGGCELAAELHKRDPQLLIVVSSGYTGDTAIADYKKYGFAAVLHKPYSFDELKSVLAAVLPTSE
jgi:PAS domain S-box-containing protein